MSTAITLDNLNSSLLMKKSLIYSSDSLVENTDKVEDEIIADKLLSLKGNIGEKLYNRLSLEQKMFIINVSGTVHLGKSVDIDAVYRDIEKIEYE